MADLSTTAATNSPAGSESPSNGDDFLRAIQAIVRTTNAKGADIASATTTDIGAATGEFVDVTGTTTITGLGTIAAGIVRTVRFTGALTLTHNATSLILPSSANILTAANDRATFRSLGSGNWICVNYTKANGSPIAGYVDTNPIAVGSADATKKVRLEVDGLTTATTRVITVPDRDLTLADPLTSSTTIATTSGTSHDFTGIPSWVKRITLNFSGVSTNGTSAIILQIGDSGGIETSGYLSAAYNIGGPTSVNAVGGYAITSTNAAAAVYHGSYVLSLLDAATNTWAGFGNLGQSNTANVVVSGGSKPLSATLDRLRLTTAAGVDTFDAGSINILYE